MPTFEQIYREYQINGSFAFKDRYAGRNQVVRFYFRPVGPTNTDNCVQARYAYLLDGTCLSSHTAMGIRSRPKKLQTPLRSMNSLHPQDQPHPAQPDSMPKSAIALQQ
ncbi:MAG: hypothetical protein CMJ75_20190 [Planctomycetaceae bacterium]|nr:hypothetical protein [Planctomycetaceae bacterium]